MAGVLAALSIAAPALAAQEGSPSPTDATRAQLETSAAQLEQMAASASGEEQLQFATQAAAIRTRLRDGDFKAGDRIVVSVDTGVVAAADSFAVREGPAVELPGMPPISLKGVLHSELSDYLTQQFARYLRDPTVKAYALLRVGVFGPVATPGFYQLPSDVLFSDAIMRAGGPAQTAELNKTVVKRGEREIISKRDTQKAMVYGYTLSQMNIRDGDAIYVGGGTQRNWTNTLRAVSLGVGLALTVYQISKQF
jgi:protein involved in polysaccharide export with SLBB domain